MARSPRSGNRGTTTKKSSSDSPMPQAGAGLIRFYQDASNGIKVSPTTSIVCAFMLMLFTILGHAGALGWLFG